MNRNEFINANPIDSVLESRGVKLIGGGNTPKAKCPFHEDRNPSLSVDLERGLWNCHAGCGGGSVIDLLAKFDGVSPTDILKRYTSAPSSRQHSTTREPAGKSTPTEASPAPPKSTIEKTYQYQNELGADVYQVVRLTPKSFRQRHSVNGEWVWSMEGITRVLYRLPEVVSAEQVIIVEGEKDADNLAALGFCATCNVGGAGKWLDGYTDTLTGKKVVLCGDNDAPGKKHMDLIFESLAGKAAEVRVVTIPKPYKDVSDWIAATPNAAVQFREMIATSTPFLKGIRLPIVHFAEMEDRYAQYAQRIDADGLHLGSWLPGFTTTTRPLVPGELVVILGATGVGKTALLSNIAMAARHLRTLFFELELPEELLFERLVAMRAKLRCDDVEKAYKSGEKNGREVLTKYFPNLYICTQSRLTIADIEQYINRAELKIGDRPQLILLDYLGLVKGIGSSRYDRVSQIAEDLKVMAKSTNTIVVCASQITRKPVDDSPEVLLTDAKDSGSIENSAGLVLGAWRDPKDSTLLNVKILKNTKGTAGCVVPCRYNGATMRIAQLDANGHSIS